MAIEHYIKARKLGLKAYSANQQKRLSPYLPVLDEMVEHLNELTHVNLGLIQIPLKNVVGTGTKGRTNAFACNFMPILDPNSEFSTKWSKLYDGIVADGLRQPVRCLEYMNRYYLLEGNKRASVMKFLDAVFIEAEVIRVIPKRTDEPQNILYFEFLDFYKDTSINTIWFTQPGSFEKLCELTGHVPGERWPGEDRQRLNTAYMRFRNEYKELFGERFDISTGDAFLIYLTVYGYEGTPEKLSTEMAEEIKPLESEFERSTEDETVALILDPSERTAPGLLKTLFGPDKIKVGFLYHHAPDISGWNYWHDLGRINAENALDGRMECHVMACEHPDEFEDAMTRLIEKECELIFTTSPLMLDVCMNASLQYPHIKILNCSLLASYYHVRSYYLRAYEAKFLIGMVAGSMAENDKIGYIADYPIYGVPASINAFAAGARMVNPRAKIHVAWSTQTGFDFNHPFEDPEIRIISNRDINAPRHSSKEYGLYAIDSAGQVSNLAIPVLDWSRFYEEISLSVLNGSFEDDENKKLALNYWWGMSSDALDIILSNRLDPYLQRLIHSMQGQLQSGQLWPFEGELRDQNNVLRCEKDAQLTPAQILSMDYLADNVIGSIPTIDQIMPFARPMVLKQGLHEIDKPDVDTFSWTHRKQG